ncbi:hypothetical protein [Sciscionella sediminilitoris]|uniref:hypothetical protein n=1 Tax=Sciscionella sediminilitoris TaxID=1445613 RepID=UPI0009E79FB9|nr:hypothetical protein [Sciscionella sp. SE31]
MSTGTAVTTPQASHTSGRSPNRRGPRNPFSTTVSPIHGHNHPLLVCGRTAWFRCHRPTTHINTIASTGTTSAFTVPLAIGTRVSQAIV